MLDFIYWTMLTLSVVAAFNSTVLSRVLPLLAAWPLLVLAYQGLR